MKKTEAPTKPKLTDADIEGLLFSSEGGVVTSELGGLNFKVINKEQIDSGRWTSDHELIFRDSSSGMFWCFIYECPLTEIQDVERVNSETINLCQVEPYKATITKYRRVK